MTGLGLTQAEIANLIGISDRTLRTRYRTELNNGVAEANLRVAQSLFALATKDRNVAACIWWTKARMGWREQQDLNLGGNGQPITYEFCWRDDAEPAAARASKSAPPTIEAEPDEARDAGSLVTWAGEND